MELVKVQRAPGQYIKLTRKQAEAYVAAHPGTFIVEKDGAQPAPAAAPEAASSDMETKMVSMPPENKSRSRRA